MKKTKKKPSATLKNTSEFYDTLNSNRASIILLIISLVLLSFLYKPLVFEGQEVVGTDKLTGIGTVNKILEYHEATGEKALWNPYVFGGMPRYHRYGTAVGSLDTLYRSIGSILDWRVAFLWLGMIGVFLLVKYLGFSNMVGIITGFAFAVMPHFQALIVVGHDSKLRAIMWIPFVLLTFLMFTKRRDIFSVLLFSLVFTLQFRTQHYQIIFYTLLLLLFTGIGTYIKLMIDKRWTEFLKGNLLLLGSIALFLVMVAHPFLSIREYTPHSTRGGNAVNLQQQNEQRQSGGVSFEYATNWSFSVPELYDLIIPKFHGGTSQELYTGDSVPAFQNRQIPAYWGDKPFTQSYEYMGILLVMLAVFGMVFQWKHPLVKSLTFLTLFALLLSLGSNFEAFYRIFFYNLPYFDTFRAPVMILTLIMFNVAILGAIGLHSLIQMNISKKVNQQRFYIIAGVFALLILIPLLLGSNFALSKPGEAQQYIQQYGEGQATQLVEMLRMARLDIMQASATRTLIFFILFSATIFVLMKSYINRGVFLLITFILIGLDLGILSNSFLQGQFTNETRMEQQLYGRNSLDQFLESEDSLFRVAPLASSLTNNTRWSYYYQSIGGYSAAKLQVIQDIIENNIYVNTQGDLPYNLQVLSMLDAQYLVTPRPFDTEQVNPVQQEEQQGFWLLENTAATGRAFFADTILTIPDGKKRLRFMNSTQFDASRMAILEQSPDRKIQRPENASVSIEIYNPDEIILNYSSDSDGLLVLSEIYYPHGWSAQLEDGSSLEIMKTNHLIRSMFVPAGEHTITMEFHPDSYYLGTTISWIGFLLAYAGILFLLYREHRTAIHEKIRSISQNNA